MSPLVKLWQLEEHSINPDIHHRKWGWADEQTGMRSILLPSSFRKGFKRWGQVLGLGPAGAWDSTQVAHTCCLWVKGKYYMFYAGRDDGWTTAGRIGLALSDDGYTFTRYGVDGKILDPPAGWTSLMSPGVIYDYYETDPAKKWKALILAYDPAYAEWDVLYFRGSNPWDLTFVKEVTKPPDWFRVSNFIRFGNCYFWAYRDTTNNTRLSVYNYEFDELYNYGQIIPKGAAGEWDEKIGSMSIFGT